jgi:uncharacterized membrane protein
MPRLAADLLRENGRFPLLLAAAAAGVLVSGYLTLIHYRGDLLVCAVGSCETVQNSEYAELFGLPVALLGLLMFSAALGLVIAGRLRPGWTGGAALALFALTLAGSLFAAWLTYLEIFVIEAICQWCVLTALLTLVLCVLSADAVLRAPEGEEPS